MADQAQYVMAVISILELCCFLIYSNLVHRAYFNNDLFRFQYSVWPLGGRGGHSSDLSEQKGTRVNIDIVKFRIDTPTVYLQEWWITGYSITLV